MEEEFYATLKLISGEEIVAKVCYLPDENKLILDKPLQVESAKQKQGKIEISGFMLKEWISATFDDMFIINKDHILTMSELDTNIQKFYEKTLNKINSNGEDNVNKLSRKSGYLGSIKEVKKSLEDIYKKS